MNASIQAMVLRVTGASAIRHCETIQKLWSGYGSIVRYELDGGALSSVIVKHVAPPKAKDHPRGWNTDISHERKLKSYQVETAWYRHYASRCSDSCRVPQCFNVETHGDEVVMIMEDLDAADFSQRRNQVSVFDVRACLTWLAHFHAIFMQEAPVDLWESGTYWHLETRPDELKVLANEDPALYAAAERIDAKLKASAYQTLVHGDAKLANFCFAGAGQGVAAVDFQYVGAGCGMKDVAYFIGSCLDEVSCEANEAKLLDFYFSELRAALTAGESHLDFNALETDWRRLYAVAWTDFHRFLKGWSPGHWKIHSYSERLAREVCAQLLEEDTCD